MLSYQKLCQKLLFRFTPVYGMCNFNMNIVAYILTLVFLLFIIWSQWSHQHYRFKQINDYLTCSTCYTAESLNWIFHGFTLLMWFSMEASRSQRSPIEQPIIVRIKSAIINQSMVVAHENSLRESTVTGGARTLDLQLVAVDALASWATGDIIMGINLIWQIFPEHHRLNVAGFFTPLPVSRSWRTSITFTRWN